MRCCRPFEKLSARLTKLKKPALSRLSGLLTSLRVSPGL